MRKTLRLGLLAAAVATVLASASSAFGAYAPKLTISRADEVTEIRFTQTDADNPTARVVILAPAGYTPGLSQAPGTQLGTLEGSVIAGAFGGATVPVAGTIVAGDTSNATLRATAKQCTGTEGHAAIWLLNVTAAGQSLPAPVPLFVDPTTAPLSAFTSTSIQLCLPPPPMANFQIKLLDATLIIGNTLGILSPPSSPGGYRWTAINTPYKADNSGADPAGTVETQGIDATPVDPSFTARRITKTRRVKHRGHTDILYTYSVRLSGNVQAGGQPVGGAAVELFSGPEQKAGEATTNDNGAFTRTMRLTRTAAYHATYAKEASDVAGASCVPPIQLAPGVDMPCASVTQGGFFATTEEARVVKPKLTRKHVEKEAQEEAPLTDETATFDGAPTGAPSSCSVQ